TIFLEGTYTYDNVSGNVVVTRVNHGLLTDSLVYLEFSNDELSNGEYTITYTESNSLIVLANTIYDNSSGDILIGFVT
ncbi:MAG: hypothetical protein WD512_03845, partial [Candidatus Paceibacterota bacterium]